MPAGQLLYALVARGTVVLAEHSTVTGNANLVAHRILERLGVEDSRASYSQDRMLFHILVSSGLTYMCMADESIGRRIPFAFLDDVRDKLTTAYGSEVHTAVAYEFNTEFARTLAARMDFFSNDPSADAINRVRGELSSVKNIMVENIEKVLERGEKIELLVNKTDHLQSESFAFRRSARGLKNRMWWQNIRMLAAVAAVMLIILYVIVCFTCSPTFKC